MGGWGVGALGWEGIKGLGSDYKQADMTHCRIPDKKVIAGGLTVKDRHGNGAATQLLFCFFCV